jgi:hypothetical protein
VEQRWPSMRAALGSNQQQKNKTKKKKKKKNLSPKVSFFWFEPTF